MRKNPKPEDDSGRKEYYIKRSFSGVEELIRSALQSSDPAIRKNLFTSVKRVLRRLKQAFAEQAEKGKRTKYNDRDFQIEAVVLQLVSDETDIDVDNISSSSRKEEYFKARCLVFGVLTTHPEINYSSKKACTVINRVQAGGRNIHQNHLNFLDTDKFYRSIFDDIMRSVDLEVANLRSEVVDFQMLENQLISEIEKYLIDGK